MRKALVPPLRKALVLPLRKALVLPLRKGLVLPLRKALVPPRRKALVLPRRKALVLPRRKALVPPRRKALVPPRRKILVWLPIEPLRHKHRDTQHRPKWYLASRCNLQVPSMQPVVVPARKQLRGGYKIRSFKCKHSPRKSVRMANRGLLKHQQQVFLSIAVLHTTHKNLQ